MGDLTKIVGVNQKRLRGERGMSLDALAKASGVSRSRLSQIENGDANPSIATVWQIASALKVGFSELVATPEGDSQVVRVLETEPTISEDGRYRVYPVFAFDPTLGFEQYECELDAGGTVDSAPHPVGTQETVMVVAGRLAIRVGDVEYIVCADEAIRFRADQPHGYRNLGTTTARHSMIVAYARRG